MKQDYEKDWPDFRVKYLILSVKGQFIVGVDEDLDVDWKTSNKYDETGPKDPEKFNEVIIQAAFLECTPSHQLPEVIRLRAKRLIGEAIARALDHQYDQATSMLRLAKQYIDLRNGEQSRFWYLSASGVTTIALILTGATLWLFRWPVVAQIGWSTLVLALAGIAGAVGAQLSIIMRLGKTSLDIAAGRQLHFLEAVSRIAAGMFSAIIVAFAVKSGLLLQPLSQSPNNHITILLAGIIAGVSERWAPSIISQVTKASLPELKSGDSKLVE